jgi:CDP-diacylglycerol--glycerol-3-phosphate 3-phosphatidyltransferase
MVLAAWLDSGNTFLILLAVALITDALDGFFARRLGQTSSLGAQLDSWGDLAVFFAVPIAAWLLWPEIIRREFFYVTVAMISFIVPIVAGWLRFRRLTSYHTWGAKATAVALAISTPILLLNGPPLLFRIAVLLLSCTALEEICITLILPAWQSDVRSLWHALAIRRHRFEL